jgi:DNA-binding MarR family transcriptional regulator
LEITLANIVRQQTISPDTMSFMSASRLDTWRAVVTSHAAVNDHLQKAFSAAGLPPLSWFEVLRAVRHSQTGRPRMSELAEWLTLSRGGITKLVDRLEQAGFLERVSCAEDRRSLHTRLTPTGEQVLEKMQATYTAEVERHLSTLTAEEAELITAALEKVTGGVCREATST